VKLVLAFALVVASLRAELGPSIVLGKCGYFSLGMTESEARNRVKSASCGWHVIAWVELSEPGDSILKTVGMLMFTDGRLTYVSREIKQKSGGSSQEFFRTLYRSLFNLNCQNSSAVIDAVGSTDRGLRRITFRCQDRYIEAQAGVRSDEDGDTFETATINEVLK
jgi:hypothetical protein